MKLRHRLPTGCAVALLALAAIALDTTLARERTCRAGATEQQCVQDTRLLVQSLNGDMPNGPSRNAEISHGGRNSRWNEPVVFESDATDLVRGDTNGMTDVFAIRRKRPFPDDGSAWERGATVLVSRAPNGGPANGRSYNPAVDGEFPTPANCIGFISEASNLVPGDTNGVADAFVYFLAADPAVPGSGPGKIVRISVSTGGAQANGPSFDVDFDGDCARVAFTSSANNLQLRSAGFKRRTVGPRGRRRVIRIPNVERAPYVTRGRPPAGVRQVYLRQLRGCQRNQWNARKRREDCAERELRGMTALISMSDSRRPGNGDSVDPSFAYRFNGNHKLIAFQSRATNLDRRDRNARDDVYARDLTDRERHDTLLVSQTARGKVGDAASREPAFGEQGFHISFETDASNLFRGDRNGVTDVIRADICKRKRSDRCLQRRRAVWSLHPISRDAGGLGNGPSRHPEVSNGGSYTVFESDATNFKGASGKTFLEDDNDASDVYLFTFERRINLLQSRNSNTGKQRLRLPSTNPAISSRGNYILFETNDPYADVNWVERKHPEWFARNSTPIAVSFRRVFRQLAASQPRFHQIYMRELGSKKFAFVNPGGGDEAPEEPGE